MGTAVPYIATAALAYYQSQHQPQPQTPPAVKPPPQRAKAPNASAVSAAMQGTGQAGGKAGYAQTFLTGPAGIDPNALKLGKPTLLGS